MYFRGPISKRNGVSEKDFQRLKFGLRVFLLIVANLLLVIQVSLSLIFKTLFDTHFQIYVCLVLKSCLYSFSPGERGREGAFRRRGVGSGSN